MEQIDDRVRVVEVGPRDGLQNEDAILPVSQRVELIHRLVEAGAKDVEVGSFVHPKWIPQMADTDEVARLIERRPEVTYWGLVPNMRGLERALAVDIDHVALVLSASETHNQKNVNRSIEQSMEILRGLFEVVRERELTARVYISMVFGCPYEGDIDFGHVMDLAEQVLEMGADHVSLGDTVGMGVPPQVRRECARIISAFGADRVALHLHDTRGMGVTNAMVAHAAGMRIFDSSLGGIGGCPYAPGAAGNLGTEDLVYLMESLGVETGMDLGQLVRAATWLEEIAEINVPSRCSNYVQSQQV